MNFCYHNNKFFSWDITTALLCVLTKGFVRDSVDGQDEIIFEEDVADYGEEIDEDEGEHSCQHNGAAISRNTLDHVQ